MGCASSKQKRCRHCRAQYSPTHRSFSPDHLVALTSSTLGSLKLDHCHHEECLNDGGIDFAVEINDAKAWSAMIEEKIVPIRTPPGETPEIINTWELMEGLEEVSPFRSPTHLRSFSFDVVKKPTLTTHVRQPKPLWLHMENDDSDEQQITISTFKNSLEDLSSNHPFRIFNTDDTIKQDNLHVCKIEKVVLYFTSLRGVRKTYEDCCSVRAILKGIGVRIDERDVSMHSGFKEELKELLGGEFYRGGLPRVFIGRRYVGGGEEIRRLHDEGKLEKALEGCEMEEKGVCEACGDVRFVPCETCSGSCKIYYEDQYLDEDDNKRGDRAGEGSEEGEFGFQRCPNCNENGLIRCPICCD